MTPHGLAGAGALAYALVKGGHRPAGGFIQAAGARIGWSAATLAIGLALCLRAGVILVTGKGGREDDSGDSLAEVLERWLADRRLDGVWFDDPADCEEGLSLDPVSASVRRETCFVTFHRPDDGRELAVGLDASGTAAAYEFAHRPGGSRVLRLSAGLGAFRNEDELFALLDRLLQAA